MLKNAHNQGEKKKVFSEVESFDKIIAMNIEQLFGCKPLYMKLHT